MCKNKKIILVTSHHMYITLDSDNHLRSGCRNVSHCHRQQPFLDLPSPGRSHCTIDSHYIISKKNITIDLVIEGPGT